MNALFIIADLLSLIITILMCIVSTKTNTKSKITAVCLSVAFTYILAMLITATVLLWR